MKLVKPLLLTSMSVLTILPFNHPVEITIKPTWQNLDANPETIKEFGGKWVLVGVIEMKKRSLQSAKMDRLILSWRGPHLEKLNGSLYKKDLDKKFMPIEEHVVSDGYWDKEKQQLILSFDQPLTIEAHNTLCLVLTIPFDVEKSLQEGMFVVESSALPRLLQESLVNKSLTIACNPNNARVTV